MERLPSEHKAKWFAGAALNTLNTIMGSKKNNNKIEQATKLIMHLLSDQGGVSAEEIIQKAEAILCVDKEKEKMEENKCLS